MNTILFHNFPAIKGIKTGMIEEYKVRILNLDNPEHKSDYQSIMSKPGVRVMDKIESQLEELMLCRYPASNLDQIRAKGMINQLLGDQPSHYGNWVYYPWDNTIIHLLPEEEFIEVRTNRNRNKISKEEQAIFATKTVGIAGLSVGRSAAVTIATERTAGKLVLADFDKIELSNLNRIKAPLTDLGLNKCISVAREIAYLDPYFDVVCFTEGLTLDNIVDFFGKEDKIDLFIEECDSVEMKIKARLFAKELQVPVTMETSDRCLVDIERFDLEPDRPILHGILDQNDIDTVGSLKSFDEKLKLMSKIVDVNAVSGRMLASLPEIGKTLRTWPQLASDVTYGGGLMAKIIRGVFDNSITSSGRYYLDSVENLTNQKEHT